jgi:hypothetical protein
MSARVASGFRMVWSIRAAIVGSILVRRSLAETRSAPAAIISLVLRAQVCGQRCRQIEAFAFFGNRYRPVQARQDFFTDLGDEAVEFRGAHDLFR